MWTKTKMFDTWEDFRDRFYYPYIVKRKWNGQKNIKMRKSSQSAEQEIHDLWRENMGFDAPWTDAMLFYDHGKVIAIGEIKRGNEGWSNANKRAAENCADRLGVPLVLMRFFDKAGPVEVSMYNWNGNTQATNALPLALIQR